jgi:UDP:flavonoid glycosyltransferase YjiC (YdhE family)
MVALSIGLMRAGQEVRLVTHSTFESFVRSHKVEYHRLAGNPLQDLLKEEGLDWIESGQNPIRFVRNLLRISLPLVPKMFHDSWVASQDADVILFHGLAPQGYHIAAKLGIPSFLVSFQPMSMTGDFPMLLFPQSPRLGRAWNRMSYRIAEQLGWQPIRTLINRFLREELRLPPFEFLGNLRRMRLHQQQCLYGFSSFAFPKPADWDEWHHITGYWFLEQTEGWDPPKELVDFISSGPRPVYIGFGSMTDRDPKRLLQIALDAIKSTGQRAVLHRGWAGLHQEDVPPAVLLVDAVPHEWLFPQMSVVAHHGGAGTTASGLRAGVPTVIVPFFADQPWWGKRVQELGVGPAPIARKKLTAENLAKAIDIACNDRQMRTVAAGLGRQISAEDGIARAIDVILGR